MTPDGPLVVVDVWDRSWCKTAGARVEALVPRLNRGLKRWRQAGGTVIWHPNQHLQDTYWDHPAHRKLAAIAVERPAYVREAAIFPLQPDPASRCECGAPACQAAESWTRLHPGLSIQKADYLFLAPGELSGLLQQHGWRHVYYAGGGANWCMQESAVGFVYAYALGYAVTILRDLTLVWHGDDPHDPDGYDQRFYQWYEAHYGPAQTLQEVLGER